MIRHGWSAYGDAHFGEGSKEVMITRSPSAMNRKSSIKVRGGIAKELEDLFLLCRYTHEAYPERPPPRAMHATIVCVPHVPAISPMATPIVNPQNEQ